ncbi:MAG: efflux RND transporter permease subunit, partial [Desulfobacterales bacterium]|nr:efflux RND transporter permease subunit [Desulfobacterales bacterium]
MKTLGKWSINNRVTVNLVMIFIFVAGAITISNMRRELFPQFALDFINVTVPYPGASPEEIEEGICVKIEEKLKGIEGISRIISAANEGSGSVTVELESSADAKSALDDIKKEIDRIDTFPTESEKPIVTEIVKRDPTVSVAVYGDVSERLLREVAEKIRDDLIDTKSISLVDLIGVREYEISVEVSEENLTRYSISFDHVVRAIKSGSI